MIGEIMVGFLLGFFVHRTKFCFHSVFTSYFRRNKVLVRLLLLIITSLIISINLTAWIINKDVSALISPLGLFTILGSIIIGIGISLAKGDAVSSLWKSVSGNMQSVSVVIGIFVGIFSFRYAHPILESAIFGFYNEKVFLPDFWFNPFVASIIFFLFLFYVFSKEDS